ncbi:putative ABC1 protein At2g40090 isoform X1 [Dendrobium catenatum]|uniref:putative ABC1 protein At2g40090 isoform X1 n=1 Tax=Dendrobium catenatum TaxID=906689 RepID=UPI00109F9D8C|nr:putative ABC1 protein At2g40090 isoform X1 [Dendrobium catenatum]
MWRVGAKLVVGATLLGGGAAGVNIFTSDDISTAFNICTLVPVRLLRDSLTAATIAFDYGYSLWGLKEGSIEWSKAKHEVHNRCALRLQELCFRNGGIYIKLGQHIGQLEYVVPQEYVHIMRTSMLKRCPFSSYDQVRKVLTRELGGLPEEIFEEFDPVPLASASLAQVHAARTHDGKNVAVKVQHTHLTDTATADIATVTLIVNALNWFFPEFDYRWLVDEIRESSPKELDFLFEARNSEKCLENFKRLSPHIADCIYVPKVYWDLSTSKVLTMEYMDAAEITDLITIQRLGIQLSDVSKLVSQAFAEMIFRHGFVHCDPHAANMMVRPLPSGRKNLFGNHESNRMLTPTSMLEVLQEMKILSPVSLEGQKKPQLILLDHGLYKNLDFATRVNYASLWKALIFADVNGIKENSVKLGAGEDLYALFAGVLTMRPWNRVIDPSVDHLILEGSDTDRSELQMYASHYFTQISELLRRLPRVILLMLKTNDCLRAVNHVLLQGSSLETYLIIGRVSSKAVSEAKIISSNCFILSGLSLWLEQMLLEARLFSMRIALWLLHIQKTLYYRTKKKEI